MKIIWHIFVSLYLQVYLCTKILSYIAERTCIKSLNLSSTEITLIRLSTGKLADITAAF